MIKHMSNWWLLKKHELLGEIYCITSGLSTNIGKCIGHIFVDHWLYFVLLVVIKF